MSLTDTPRSNRLHIGIYGKRNSGKSSLINALTNQNAAIVSDVAGTTADPVYKTMEIHGIGPCVFIDTAGFDDEGTLGTMRVEKTKAALEKTDIALLVCSDDQNEEELSWAKDFAKKKIPYLLVLNKIDEHTDKENLAATLEKQFKKKPLQVSALQKTGIEELRQALIRSIPEDYEQESIVGNLAETGDLVLLVMPQDIQAPKGRLILPQVQIMRDLLDKKCLIMSCTTDKLDETLKALAYPPKLIITDSQVFSTVYEKKPKESNLTSFSVLFARYKGDIQSYVEGARAIENLTEDSHVLIAEACTHAPLTEDIGREKIPRFLRKRIGENLKIDIVAGNDYPKDLTGYDLIIHCGACMFNRKYVLSRQEQAREANVPMTNYGIVIAYLNNILDKIKY
ncbi:MAG: [FeFe] hydrogenase H-cluster maturation GTPase HydF [Lachnospiraceae bacterium]|nr:[FeFe] hydrogenase H-cluster maturation GTPase HydF [Lachnospiraceae bacterium]MDD3615697.1 [FeFe] hydrogenase H-cluster maturation GTPase HydF [Lachnospiraceae bacterium]